MASAIGIGIGIVFLAGRLSPGMMIDAILPWIASSQCSLLSGAWKLNMEGEEQVMIERIVATLALACCAALAMPGAASAAPAARSTGVSSQQQGLHQWPVLDGKLILVNGTYQDVLTYKRSLTFYFESKASEDWLHVPVIDGDRQHDLTWFHISRGEDTIADAIVVARAGGVELVLAETGRGERAPIAVRRFRFTEAGDDDLDGPGYFFKKISAINYPASAGLTVEQVLEKELSKSKK